MYNESIKQSIYNWRENHRDEYNEYMRKFVADPEYRIKWRAYANAYQKERYANDPEYREREKARAREKYRRKKERLALEVR